MLAIPPGTPDPFMAGVRAILEPGRLTEFATEAREWVRVAIATLKRGRAAAPGRTAAAQGDIGL
jgi:hypothetical protein